MCLFIFLPYLSGMQVASFLRSIILASVACLAVPYFPTLSYKRYDFRKNYWTYNACFDFLYKFCLKLLIVRRIQRDIIINICRSSCKVPVILVRFEWNLNFLDRVSKNPQNKILWKSIQWEPSFSMRTDGRTDRHDEA